MTTLAKRLRLALDEAAMNGTDFEKAAKLPSGYASRLLSGQRGKRMAPETLKRMADVLGVMQAWLGTGEEPMRAPGVRSASPVSSTRPEPEAQSYELDDLDQLINESFVGDRHLPSDAAAVRKVLEDGAHLLRPDASPVDFVRTLLDIAARLREKGEKATALSILRESVAVISQNAGRLDPLVAEFRARGRAHLRELGIEPRNTPHPALDALDDGTPMPPKTISPALR